MRWPEKDRTTPTTIDERLTIRRGTLCLRHPHTQHITRHRRAFIRKHVFSLDHKVIGKQYYALAWSPWSRNGAFLADAHSPGLAELAHPGAAVALEVGAPGGVMTPEYYLSLMTMHGTLMVFFVLTNAPFAAFGNYFLPIQIGAEDMAFPRFNMMSFWTTFIAFCILITAFFVPDGPPLAGWTAYAPLSAVGKDVGPRRGISVKPCGDSRSLCSASPRCWDRSTSSRPPSICAPKA